MEKTINGLFIGTKYGVLGLSSVGILGSIILFFANMAIGMSSAILCIAALALCIALVIILMPKKMTIKESVIAVACLVVAFAITGIVYYSNGGFPHMNLLFITT